MKIPNLKGLKPSPHFLISLGLHFLLTGLLIFQFPKKGHPPSAKDSQKISHRVEIIPNPPEKPTELIINESKNPGPEKTTQNDQKCEEYFGGIGITYVTVFEEGRIVLKIYKVHPGYPAEKAGIRKGDELEIEGKPEITGTPGTSVTVHLRRGSRSLTKTLIRAKICVKNDSED